MNGTSRFLAAFFLASAIVATGSEPKQSPEIVPELAGAERVTGPVLVDGELPAPYIDYIVQVAPGHTQKLSVFQNGLVALSTTVGDKKSLKRVLFPPGAIDIYRDYLNLPKLKRTNVPPVIATPTRLRETIRIYDEEGDSVERTYDPALYLTSDLETIRGLLHDLMRVVIEDNEITSPMVDYEPKPGDVLLDQQMRSWRVMRVVNEHVEVEAVEEPLRVWLKRDQLDEQFTSWSRSVSPSE